MQSDLKKRSGRFKPKLAVGLLSWRKASLRARFESRKKKRCAYFNSKNCWESTSKLAVGLLSWRKASLRARFESRKKKHGACSKKRSELLFLKLACTSAFLRLIRTSGGNRTHTVLLPLDFESSASTSSATEADVHFSDGIAVRISI